MSPPRNPSYLHPGLMGEGLSRPNKRGRPHGPHLGHSRYRFPGTLSAAEGSPSVPHPSAPPEAHACCGATLGLAGPSALSPAGAVKHPPLPTLGFQLPAGRTPFCAQDSLVRLWETPLSCSHHRLLRDGGRGTVCEGSHRLPWDMGQGLAWRPLTALLWGMGLHVSRPDVMAADWLPSMTHTGRAGPPRARLTGDVQMGHQQRPGE